MKKIFLLVGSFLLIGCAANSTYKDNTLKAIKIEPNVEVLPVAADLAVSEQRVSGEATGLIVQRDLLEKEAVANALGQNPPSPDKPDVLVGKTMFEEINARELKIRVTGYPAYYTNFRNATEKDEPLAMVKTNPASQVKRTEHAQSEPKPKAEENMYFTAKFIFGDNFDFGLELGKEWANGFFLGGGAELGVINNFGGGGGLSIGGVSRQPNNLKLIGGVSAGFWLIEKESYYYRRYGYYEEKVMFGGPFAKIRWKGLETGLRILFGQENRVQFSVGYTL